MADYTEQTASAANEAENTGRYSVLILINTAI